MYEWRNHALIDLPMRMGQHDIVNVRTLDVSGNDHHAILGDGVTPALYPAKLDYNRGYLFDGGDHMTFDGGFDFGTGDFSIFALVDGTGIDDYRAIFYSMETGSATGAGLLTNTATGVLRAWVGTFAFNGATNILDGLWHTVGVVRNGDVAKLYFDGREDGFASGLAAQSGSSTQDAMIGVHNLTPQYNWIGSIGGVLIDDKALTPLQVNDYHIQMIKKVNDI